MHVAIVTNDTKREGYIDNTWEGLMEQIAKEHVQLSIHKVPAIHRDPIQFLLNSEMWSEAVTRYFVVIPRGSLHTALA